MATNCCCVRGCDSKRTHVKLHRFPIRDKGLHKWLECFDSDERRSLTLKDLKKCYVCHKHFENRFITPKSHLIGSAYPSLFTAEEISNGIPTVDHENVDPHAEHNYSRKRHYDHTYCKIEQKQKPSNILADLCQNTAALEVSTAAEPITLTPKGPWKLATAPKITAAEPQPSTSKDPWPITTPRELSTAVEPEPSKHSVVLGRKSREKLFIGTDHAACPPNIDPTAANDSSKAHYADGTPVSGTLRNTTDIVNFFDDLFDSVNGASLYNKKTKGKELRTAVTTSSKHHTFWKEALKKIDKIKYIHKGKEISVPTLKNWAVTLNSLIRLWECFKENDLKILRPRYFNSDPIENFFGQVRAYNYRNNNPNCHMFTCTFKSLLVTRIIKFHSETFNCEDDAANQLLNIKTLFDEAQTAVSESNDLNIVENISESIIPLQNIVQAARQERLEVHSRAYTTGWVVRKVFATTKDNCKTCKSNLTSTTTQPTHNWISSREYKKARKALCYPSEHAVRYFGIIVAETNKYLDLYCHETRLLPKIKNKILCHCQFTEINCPDHKNMIREYFMDITIRLTIFNWCNTINKILNGTDISRLEKRSLPLMQSKALMKYRKKLKKNIK